VEIFIAELFELPDLLPGLAIDGVELAYEVGGVLDRSAHEDQIIRDGGGGEDPHSFFGVEFVNWFDAARFGGILLLADVTECKRGPIFVTFRNSNRWIRDSGGFVIAGGSTGGGGGEEPGAEEVEEDADGNYGNREPGFASKEGDQGAGLEENAKEGGDGRDEHWPERGAGIDDDGHNAQRRGEVEKQVEGHSLTPLLTGL